MKESERVNILERLLFTGTTTPMEFEWEQLAPDVDLYQLVTQEDIDYIHGIITSARYSGNSRLRISKIDEIMKFRNFTKFAGGTNRLVYIHPMAPNMVFKVAVDAVGIRDNPSEYYNQKLLKPFCTKVFQCSPCGTIASFQRVEKITSEEEFLSVLDDYILLMEVLVDGKHVFDDIGAKYFMNYGIWKGKGLVILDFPYMYEIDGSKLTCKNILDDGTICNGEIDYTKTFDEIRCTKCGRIYRAGDLAKTPESGASITRRKGEARMKFSLKRGDKIIKTIETGSEVDYLTRKERNKPKYVKAEDKYKVRPAKLIKVKKVTTLEHTENPFSVDGSTIIIKAKGNTTNQQQTNNTTEKEVVKYVGIDLRYETPPKSDDKPSAINPKLIKVKRKIKPNDSNQFKNKKVRNVGSYVDNKKSTVVRNKPDVVVNKIVGNTNINTSSANDINTKKDDTIKPGVIKVKKISIPESEVKKFSTKSTTIVEPIKEEVVITTDSVSETTEKPIEEEVITSTAPEEEKQDIINSLTEEESKKITDTYNAAVEIIKSVSPIVTTEVKISTESTNLIEDKVEEEETKKETEEVDQEITSEEDDDKEYYEVRFVGEFPNESIYEDSIIYAIYTGGNDFENQNHTEYIENLAIIDRSLYDLYGTYEGKLYSIDIDEEGNISYLYDDEEYYEDEEESSSDSNEESGKSKSASVDTSNVSYEEDDDAAIIDALKKSVGKPSVIDVL